MKVSGLKVILWAALLITGMAKAQQTPADARYFGKEFTPQNVVPAAQVAAKVEPKTPFTRRLKAW